MKYKQNLSKAKGFADIFSIVQTMVWDYLRKDQAGLLVGISDLGPRQGNFVGAFYSMDANTIIVNKRPLHALQHSNPAIVNEYMFHVLLHEYLQSIGTFEEEDVALLVFEITKKYLGNRHLATRLAMDLDSFVPNLTFDPELELPEDLDIEFIQGVDRQNTNYIM